MIKQNHVAPRLNAGTRATRLLLAILTVVHTAVAGWLFATSLPASGVASGAVLTILFVLLFATIAFSFWMATIGFVRRLAQLSKRATPAAPASTAVWRRRMKPIKTAILVPVYNEEPQDVFAGVVAMRQSLIERCSGDEFAFFILSDTNRADIAVLEEDMWSQVVEDGNSKVPIYYRRRTENKGRKAGNLEDFCVRWGRAYTYMIVLDADSLMDGATLQSMVDRMENKSDLGILQVPPVPINRLTWFARLQQFAANLYGPVFTEGLHAWAGEQGNYWGHNAIIRIEPFMQNCGLPILPGQAPLGGEILSHDFVEAAMMVRSGWGVELATDLGGSYEECPTNLLDYAIRDQRWCQGNLQHGRLVISEGFHPTSRFHMGMGVLSYVASPLWLSFMLLTIWVTTTADSSVVGDSGLYWQSTIFAMTLVMLFLPKFLGWIDASLNPTQRRLQGGPLRMFAGMLLESLASVLLAPTMMIFHSRFVINALRGKKIVWNRQNRDENALDWPTAWQHFGWMSVLGLFFTVCVLAAGWASLWWFLPITVGWTFAVPLAVLTSRVDWGRKLLAWGLLVVPEEVEPPAVLLLKRQIQTTIESTKATAAS